MTALIATGAFCPVEGIAEALHTVGWRVIEPQAIAEAGPTVAVLDDGGGRLVDLLMASSARAILLHVSLEEALAAALCDGLDPTTALERWRASAREQTALFRRMRERVALVSRRRFEAAPAEVLGHGPAGATLPPWRVDPLALAIAARLAPSPPDAAASMLAACVREADRIDVPLDAQEALAAWERHAALAEAAKAATRAEGEAAALRRERDAARDAAMEATGREQALRDEIGLLQKQLAHMQTALETEWSRRDESRAEAAREAQESAEARAAAVLRQVEEMQAALTAAEAGRAAATADLAKARETLAERDKALAERDEALKAAQARQSAAHADLAKARETLAARDKALAEATQRLASTEKVGAEVEKLRTMKASQSEEIALLREQLAHLQKAFEAAWLQKEEARASASRQPPVHAGLTQPVDLGVVALPSP